LAQNLNAIALQNPMRRTIVFLHSVSGKLARQRDDGHGMSFPRTPFAS
jgi:hypothetical protein